MKILTSGWESITSPSPVERGRGWGFLSLKSSYKPHPKSFSTGEGLWKGRVYGVIRGLQIHCSKVEDYKSRPARVIKSNSNLIISPLQGLESTLLIICYNHDTHLGLGKPRRIPKGCNDYKLLEKINIKEPRRGDITAGLN